MSNIAFYWGNIPDSMFGGIDRVTNVLAQGFNEAGHRVFLIYSGGEERDFPFFISKHKFNSPEKYLQDSIKALSNYLRENDIDIIINQRAYDHNVIGSLSIAAGNISIISCLHNMPGFEFYSTNFFKRQLKKLMLHKQLSKHYQQVYDKSNKFILLSDSFKPLFSNLYLKRETSDKLYAIPNPLSFQLEKVNIEEKSKILLYVGRLEEQQKKVSKLLKIWYKLEPFHPDWKLVIIGDGSSKKKYEDYVEAQKLKNVIFEGKKDPKNYYKKASIFAMTSDYEGFGIVLTEAMQFGCVPVAFDTFTALHDIIDDNVNGIIIPKGKYNRFVQTLDNLMNGIIPIKYLALNAIKKSMHFELTNIIASWNLILEAKNTNYQT